MERDGAALAVAAEQGPAGLAPDWGQVPVLETDAGPALAQEQDRAKDLPPVGDGPHLRVGDAVRLRVLDGHRDFHNPVT